MSCHIELDFYMEQKNIEQYRWNLDVLNSVEFCILTRSAFYFLSLTQPDLILHISILLILGSFIILTLKVRAIF